MKDKIAKRTPIYCNEKVVRIEMINFCCLFLKNLMKKERLDYHSKNWRQPTENAS